MKPRMERDQDSFLGYRFGLLVWGEVLFLMVSADLIYLL